MRNLCGEGIKAEVQTRRGYALFPIWRGPRAKDIGLDFCQSCFSPRVAAHILTLSSPFLIPREADIS